MAYRYAEQEAKNIAAAESRARQQSALNAALARRTAETTAAAATEALTKADVGLGSVDNTADTAKPVSTAQQTALNGKLNTWVAAPASAGAAGTAGQIAYDSSFIYVCVATNTWKRAALSTW